MKRFYFTFGPNHRHSIGQINFDAYILVIIEAESEGKARKKMSDAFGLKWEHSYVQAIELTDELIEQAKAEKMLRRES